MKERALNLISIVISVIAIIFSGLAVYYSRLAWIDSRRVAGLDLSPELELSEKFFKSPPEFLIYNNGPIEAMYVEVEQVWHFHKDGKIAISQAQGEHKYKTPKLAPQEKISIIFDKTLLDNARLDKPQEHNILEIRLACRRPSDKKLFRKSAFFFTNPEGRWVPEYDNSLTPSIYEPIRLALLKSAEEWARFRYPFWVPLHSN